MHNAELARTYNAGTKVDEAHVMTDDDIELGVAVDVLLAITTVVLCLTAIGALLYVGHALFGLLSGVCR